MPSTNHHLVTDCHFVTSPTKPHLVSNQNTTVPQGLTPSVPNYMPSTSDHTPSGETGTQPTRVLEAPPLNIVVPMQAMLRPRQETEHHYHFSTTNKAKLVLMSSYSSSSSEEEDLNVPGFSDAEDLWQGGWGGRGELQRSVIKEGDWDMVLRFLLVVLGKGPQPYALIFQWDFKLPDPLLISECIFLPHQLWKTIITQPEMIAQLIMPA